MKVNPYLNSKGDCAEAFKFYEKCLGGKIGSMMTHGESPMAAHVPPEWREKIIHARITVGDTVLMASDVPPEHYQAPKGISIALGIKDPVEADRVSGPGGKTGGANADSGDFLGSSFCWWIDSGYRG